MPKSWYVLLTLLICGFGWLMLSHYVWAETDYSQRKIYVFTAKWCGPCKIMERNVWPNPEIKELVNKYHHKTTIDLDDEKQKDFVDYYDVTHIPCIVITNLEGYEIKRNVGSMSVSELKRFLE